MWNITITVSCFCDIVQFLINTVIIVTYFSGASIASSWSPSSRVSALYQYYENYVFVYIIDINTHDLFFCWYNIHLRTLQGDCWLYTNTRLTGKCDIVKYYYNCLITITGLSCYLLFCFNALKQIITKYRNTLHSHYFVVPECGSKSQVVLRNYPIVIEYCTLPSSSRVNSTTYQKVSAISWKY